MAQILTDFLEVLLCCICNRPSVKRRHRRNFGGDCNKGSNCSKRLGNSSGQTEKPKRRREEPQGQENSVYKKETNPSGGIYQEVHPQQGHNGYNDHLQNSYNEECQHGGNSAGCPPTGKTCYQESYPTKHFIESQPVGCNQDVNYPRYDCRDNQQKMPVQATEQIQLNRSLQASLQMLYDGYEHTMGMIEELEKHEGHNMSAGYSGLWSYLIPKGVKKPKEDVMAIIEAELTCLDVQMTFAPPEVTRVARTKLLEETLKWLAAREEATIQPGLADRYAKNVVQVLIKPDSVMLPERERDSRSASLDERTVNELMFAFAQAQHKGDLQDKEFEANPDKKASLCKMREGEDLHSGATRLVKLDPKDGEFYRVLAASLQHLDAYAKGDLR